MQVITLFQGDLLPEVEVTLIDKVGNPLNLTQVSGVSFYMGVDINDMIVSNRACQIVDAPKGICKIVWQLGDTARVGDFNAEIVVTFSGSRPHTAGQFVVRVEESLHG